MNSEIRGKDVTNLFGHLGLSSSAYRQFPNRRATTMGSRVATSTKVAMSLREDTRMLQTSDMGPSPSKANRLGAIEVAMAPIPRTPPGKKIALFSFTGGVGKTMLSTNLARLLGSRSMRVVLVNCNQTFALEPYLPARAPHLGAFSFVHHQSGEPAIPVTVIDASASALTGVRDKSSAAILISEAILHADITLYDLPSVVDEACRQILMSVDHVVIPLTPDLRAESSMGVLEALLEQEPGTGPQLHYLLNRYDDSQSFQRTVRARVENLLGGRLYPVVVREERLLGEAMDRGQTIAEYVPEAAMVEDLHSIADWFQALSWPTVPLASMMTARSMA